MNNLSKVFSAELDGIEAKLVEVETDLHVGLHAFSIVGLADKAVSEAKERVSSALKNSGIKPPTKENRKIIINLAPAELKKGGSQYDLAIAIGYMLATKQLKKFNTDKKLFVGELALDGSLRSIKGVLNFACLARKIGYEFLFVPERNANEAAIVKDIKVIPVKNLNQMIAHLEEQKFIPFQAQTQISDFVFPESDIQLTDIKGQENAKRALMVAVAGGHNILMNGSPGGGKTMMARALISLLPPLSLEEVIEVTQIYSAAGLLGDKPFIIRPFRNPHHNASLAAVVGGGSHPKPGEVSLAHKGVLFLDELPEFRRDTLEALRQPLEGGRVVIARARNNLTLPANFMLVAAMNPCPCGYYNDDQKECVCTANEILRYQKKVSGPLLDRIDMQITVPRVELKELRGGEKIEDDREKERALEIKNKITRTRNIQLKRQKKLNAELSSKECDKLIKLNKEAEEFLQTMFKRSLVTARGYYKILKIAQTIIDLEGSDIITSNNLSEAFSYRLRDK